jgi:hypothetical protein
MSQLALWVYFINSYSNCTRSNICINIKCMQSFFCSNLDECKTKRYSSVSVINVALCDHSVLIVITYWISFANWHIHRCVLLAFSIHMVLVCALMMAVWSAILLHRSVCHILWDLFSVAMSYCASKHPYGSGLAGTTQTTNDSLWWWKTNSKFPICFWSGKHKLSSCSICVDCDH